MKHKSVTLVSKSNAPSIALHAQAEAPITNVARVAATSVDTQRTGVAPRGFMIKRSRDKIIRNMFVKDPSASCFSMFH